MSAESGLAEAWRRAQSIGNTLDLQIDYNADMEITAIQHIEMRPSAIHGEKACIAGTRIRVEDIYVWHEVQGMTPREIVQQFPQLTLADVHAALAYYWDNEELMQQQMKHGEEVAEQIRAENPPKLPELMKRLGKDADSVSS